MLGIDILYLYNFEYNGMVEVWSISNVGLIVLLCWNDSVILW